MARFDPTIGARVRAHRLRNKTTQADLAKTLGISPSYLNLIEHGKRALPAHLLLKVAQLFDVTLEEFGESNQHTASQLFEVFADDALSSQPVTEDQIREIASTNPTFARAMIALYENYRESKDAIRDVASRFASGQELELGDEPSNVASWRLPSEEVSDFLQRNQNYFPSLENAATALRKKSRVDTAPHLFGKLVEFMQSQHGVGVDIVPAATLSRAVRRYEPRTKRIALNEILAPHSLNFQLAHQIALLTLPDLLDELVDDSKLTTEESKRLGRVALSNYFAGAVMMPYEEFLESTTDLRYDVDRLGSRYQASFEQVCHRLTNLQKPSASGIPFHFLRVDIAGNISKRFSASGIQFARFSGACPRWNLVRCFATPGQITTQLSRMTDGDTYFCIARTTQRGERSFGSTSAMHAVCLGCRVEHAREMVYTDGIDLGSTELAVPVGVTCRLCDRLDCEQRAFPPIHKSLHIDENVRGYSFYASVK